MDKEEIIRKIQEKREFSRLPKIDIGLAYDLFSKRQTNDEEKIKLIKELLRKNFTAFISDKLLSLKDKDAEWILRKHISTRERINYYDEIYKRIFNDFKAVSVIDLGSGINGISFSFFEKLDFKVNYTAIESVGQLVELMNFYFKKNKFSAKAIQESLFNEDKILDIVQKEKKPRIVFLFKVIDALENIKPNYSKELILKISPFAEKIVVSFATKSLGNRKNFRAKRKWVLDFVNENFNVLDDFEIGGERYLLFCKR